MAAKLHLLLQQLRGSKNAPAVVLALALAILAGTVSFGALHLRLHLQEHMIARDGDILHAVALSQQFAAQTARPLAEQWRDPAGQLELALSISQLAEGVMAVRLFDAQGTFVTAFPLDVSEARLAAADLRALQHLNPVSHFDREAWLSSVFWTTTPEDAAAHPTPLLTVNIPLHSRGSDELLACAQLLLDGRGLAGELAQLDEHVWLQALMVFVGGAILLTAAWWWAFRRLQRANALLQERTAHLLRANHELTLTAKTNALGAVTAHLIHGLSNPLASLQDLVANRPAEPVPEADWQDVATSTHRMQQLVEEVVRVLGEQNGSDHYEISLKELVEVLAAKVKSRAQETGVRFSCATRAEGVLSNRDANLVLLILENLVQNALQATPRGKTVSLEVTHLDGEIFFEVSDAGPGFPPQLLDRLFFPCRSTRGGNGLGLAISRQLAQQLGAQLELKLSSPSGCIFELTLPRQLLVDAEPPAPTAVSG